MRETWKKIFLKDACKVFADGDWIESKDQSSDGIRLVQTGNIGFGYFKDKEDKSRFISEETFLRLKCTEILPGDLLVSRLPDPVGKSCIIPEINSKMITGVDCTIIRPKDNLSSEFLCYYQMSNQYLKDVRSGVSGATRQRISRKNLGLIEIPLPPLPEQQRIVAILDEAFVAIAKAKANAEQNLKNAKELFESYLQGVFETKGEGWVNRRLGESDLIEIIDGDRGKNYPTVKDFTDEGFCLFMNTKNVRPDGFMFNTTMFINEAKDQAMGKGKLKRNDVVMTTRGTIGNLGVYNEEVEFDNIRINSGMLIFRPNLKQITSEYLFEILRSGIIKEQIRKQVTGAAQPQLPIKTLVNFIFPVPKSLKEQQTIVQKLDTLSAETKKLEAIYQQKINDLEELKKSVLQKAFAGELKNNAEVNKELSELNV